MKKRVILIFLILLLFFFLLVKVYVSSKKNNSNEILFFGDLSSISPDIEGTSFDNSGYSWIFGITSRDKLDPNLLNKEIYKDGIPIGGLEDVEIGNRRFTVCWRYDTEVPERPLIVFGNRLYSKFEPDEGYVTCVNFIESQNNMWYAE